MTTNEFGIDGINDSAFREVITSTHFYVCTIFFYVAGYASNAVEIIASPFSALTSPPRSSREEEGETTPKNNPLTIKILWFLIASASGLMSWLWSDILIP